MGLMSWLGTSYLCSIENLSAVRSTDQALRWLVSLVSAILMLLPAMWELLVVLRMVGQFNNAALKHLQGSIAYGLLVSWHVAWRAQHSSSFLHVSMCYGHGV